MCAAGTGSSQTVCQMPETAVYQMPFGFEHLLAARLQAGVGGIPDGDDELLLLRLRLERVGDVEGERVVAAFVRADGFAVDEDLGAPVDRAEVQQQPRAFRRRRGEGAAIPEPLLRGERLLDAGERRFDGEWNESLPSN